MDVTRRLWRRLTAIKTWPLWSLPRWVLIYVLTVIALGLGAVGVGASFTTITAHDLALFGLLLGCTALAVELTRKAGEQVGLTLDVQGVWELPAAILLPPLYALLIPMVRIALVQFRVLHRTVYRRVFTGAAIGLSYGAASVIFHGLSGPVLREAGGPLGRGAVWTLLVLVCALVKWSLNKAMVMTAIKGNNPLTRIRTEVFGHEHLYNDAAETCISVLVTY